MWLTKYFVAPDLPTRQRYYYIQAAYKITLYDWLIHWAEAVESNWEDFYCHYPFACHSGPEPVRIVLRQARMTLATLMCEPDAGSVLHVLDYEISKLAEMLANWRGKAVPGRWDTTAFICLTDLTDHEL